MALIDFTLQEWRANEAGGGGGVSSVFAYDGMNFERWSMNFIRAYDEFVAKINLQLSIEL